MNENDQWMALAELDGWTNIHLDITGPGGGTRHPIPHGTPPGRGYKCVCNSYLTREDSMRSLERKLGLDDRTSLDLRVKWVNALRDIVARRIPKNRSGTSLVSDIDLMFATLGERAEALLKAHKKWKS